MMDAEMLAAEEAIRTGLYGVWRNEAHGSDFCGRVGPMSRCFCGHDLGHHPWKNRKALSPACTTCVCNNFRYMPRRPEEVGEYWLPRRRGFDVNIWRAKCKCGHSHEDHDPKFLGCRRCGCATFLSAWMCVACDGKWEDHETIWETEQERRRANRPVGEAFMPLSARPQLQHAVFDPAQSQSASLPHRSRPERSVQLMLEKCPNYGGDTQPSLDDVFPARHAPQPLQRGFVPALADIPPSRRGNPANQTRLGASRRSPQALMDATTPPRGPRVNDAPCDVEGAGDDSCGDEPKGHVPRPRGVASRASQGVHGPARSGGTPRKGRNRSESGRQRSPVDNAMEFRS